MKSIFHLTTFAFVVAKLAGYIDWSWWLVFTPSIVGVVVGLSVLAGVVWLATKS